MATAAAHEYNTSPSEVQHSAVALPPGEVEAVEGWPGQLDLRGINNCCSSGPLWLALKMARDPTCCPLQLSQRPAGGRRTAAEPRPGGCQRRRWPLSTPHTPAVMWSFQALLLGTRVVEKSHWTPTNHPPCLPLLICTHPVY